jgi:hypothetical protein
MTNKCSCKFCQFQPESNRVLNAIELAAGMEVWLAGEDSKLSDFSLKPDDIQRLSAALGFQVAQADHVWEIAQRLRSKK